MCRSVPEDNKILTVSYHQGTKAQRYKKMKVEFEKTSVKEEMAATAVVDAAFSVHNKLGPGLLERVYEVCFCHELTKKGLSFQRQVDIPIEYDARKGNHHRQQSHSNHNLN